MTSPTTGACGTLSTVTAEGVPVVRGRGGEEEGRGGKVKREWK